jgi:hypothetical protein
MANERPERQDPDGQRGLTVTVHNEDNGDSLELHAGPGTPVGTLIRRMYEKWRIERRDGDRLRCGDGGETLWGHEDEKLGEFAERCGLTWLFAGEHGGADG